MTTSLNTVGHLLDTLAAVDPTTSVTTDTGDILMNPMPGMPTSDQPVELTVAPVPPLVGETQTAAEVLDLLAPWSTTPATEDTPGPDSPLVLAPFGSKARLFNGCATRDGRITILSRPL